MLEILLRGQLLVAVRLGTDDGLERALNVLREPPFLEVNRQRRRSESKLHRVVSNEGQEHLGINAASFVQFRKHR